MTDHPPEAEVTIHGIAAGGDGVGRWPDGRAIFVARSAVGDRALVRPVLERPRFLRGEVSSRLEPGPGRVVPRCPHYQADDCGGCQLQHLGPDAQSAAKRTIVGDAMRRIGGVAIDDPQLEASDEAWEYRSKITLSRAGEREFGFHRRQLSGSVFPLTRCFLANPAVAGLWDVLRDHADMLPREADRLMLRQDRSGGLHVSARFQGTPRWNSARDCAQLLAGRYAVAIWTVDPRGRASQVGGSPAEVGADVFEQVHPTMAAKVRSAAVGSLGPLEGRHVWDLYAGIGETSSILAEAGARVSSVEVNRDAVRVSPRHPGIRYYRGTVERVAPTLDPPDLVVTNPPRAGMDAKVVDALLASRPEKIAYVSCDPATLARDLKRLAPGYTLGTLGAYDLFPQTAHVESVAMLERQ